MIKTCTFNEGEERCENMVEGRTEYCASHNALIRKAEREALKPKKKPKPIGKFSQKRVKENKEYQEKRDKYLAIFPICQAKGCGKPSTELHHRKGRQGKNLTDESFFMALCHDHHEYYTEHSAEAIEDGISLLRSVTEPHRI